GELAAVHVDLAIAAEESDAVFLDVREFDSTGVDELRTGHSRFEISGRDDFDRAAVFIDAEAPLGDVDVVGAPIGDIAAAVLAIFSPQGEVIVNAARGEDGVGRAHRRGG